MIDEIQSKRTFWNIVQCPFKYCFDNYIISIKYSTGNSKITFNILMGKYSDFIAISKFLKLASRCFIFKKRE